MINSKKKGNRFELEIAKLLTQITEKQWYRVGVSSGARFTTIGAEKFRGDITTDNIELQQYIIETKATKGRVTLEDIVNPKSKLNEWIEQCIREAPENKWILIFKANNGNTFALIQKENGFGNKFLKNKIVNAFEKYDIYLLE